MRQEVRLGLFASIMVVGCATPVLTPDETFFDAAIPDAAKADTSFKPFDSGFVPDTSTAPDSSAAPDAGVDMDAGGNPDVAVIDSGSTCPSVINGTLATFDFAGALGTQASTPAKTMATGITAGAISRAKLLFPAPAANSLNSTNWATGALDKARYVTFVITPDPKCTLDITSVTIDTLSSKTGPVAGDIGTDNDNFATTTAFVPGGSNVVKLSVNAATKAVEVRVYGHGGSSLGGTMRVQTILTVTGALN